MKLEKIEFEKIKIRNKSSVFQSYLSGIFHKEELINKLKHIWCTECLDSSCELQKSSICMECNSLKVIENGIENNFDELINYSSKEITNFLDGLYYLQLFIPNIINEVKYFIDPFKLTNSNDSFKDRISRILQLRNYLNQIGNNFKEISHYQSLNNVLLVEGKTEKIFLQKMMFLGEFRNANIIIDDYDGNNNMSDKKIKMLIENFKKIGYEIYMQGDKDGKKIDRFQNHKTSNLLKTTNIFQFEYDFETSIPLFLFHEVLVHLNLLKVNKTEFVNKLLPSNKSVNKSLLELYNVDIKKFKVMIGDYLAIIMQSNFNWREVKLIRESELGEFLLFVDSIK